MAKNAQIFRDAMFLLYSDHLKPIFNTYGPRNGIREKEMREKLCHIPEFVCFKAMNCVIL